MMVYCTATDMTKLNGVAGVVGKYPAKAGSSATAESSQPLQPDTASASALADRATPQKKAAVERTISQSCATYFGYRPASGAAKTCTPQEQAEMRRSLWTMLALESAGEVGAVSTTACKGLSQICGNTWGAYARSSGGVVRNINDPVDQLQATVELAADNRRALQALGLAQPTAFDVYMAHQQGAVAYAQVVAFTSGKSSTLPPAVARNLQLNPVTTNGTTYSGADVSRWLQAQQQRYQNAQR